MAFVCIIWMNLPFLCHAYVSFSFVCSLVFITNRQFVAVCLYHLSNMFVIYHISCSLLFVCLTCLIMPSHTSKNTQKCSIGMSDDDISSSHAHIIPRWQQPVASVVALDPPLCRVMRLISYRRTARASKMADKYGTFSSFFFLHATLSSAGAIWCEYLPDNDVQWLQVKPWNPFIVHWVMY